MNSLIHEIPKDVWNKVAADLFVCLSKLYLIVIDYTSKYFELAQLPNASSDTAITQMRSIFARHDIPKVLFSDNGPQHSSRESKKFFLNNGTSHIRLSVRCSLME